ncbi:MAG: type II toxin-antitoxin system RelE/ParE family toxin [Planctomycetaceae bacterium]
MAQDSPAYAAAFTRRVLSATESASHFPEGGAIVEEFEALGLREVYVDRYRVIYECNKDVLTILAVIHGARELKSAVGNRV